MIHSIRPASLIEHPLPTEETKSLKLWINAKHMETLSHETDQFLQENEILKIFTDRPKHFISQFDSKNNIRHVC